MDWILLTLLSALLYTSTNYIDKYIVTNRVKDVRGLIIFSAIVATVSGTLIWASTGFIFLSLLNTSIILISGAFTVWAGVLYFKAISSDDASKIIILFQSTPVFVLILSTIFLDEHISLKQFIGFITILTSTILLSLEKNNNNFKISKTFWMIIAVNLFWAVAAILLKYAVGEIPFASVVAFESLGMTLGGIFLLIFFKEIRNSFLTTAKEISKQTWLLLFINESLYLSAKAVNMYAFTLGPVALVKVVGSTQALLAILVGFLLTKIFPKLFKENITKQELLKKSSFGILIIIGLVLING